MGFRFRKSVNLGGGTKLNISKSGIGISTGIKGARKSINTSGKSRTTISVPGTGVSYVKESGGNSGTYHQGNAGGTTSGTYYSGSSAMASGGNRPPKKPFFQRTWVMILLLVFFAPAGIFLIWKNCPRWHPAVKAGLSLMFGLIWIGAILGSGESADPVNNIPQEVVNTEQNMPVKDDTAQPAESNVEDPNRANEIDPNGTPDEFITAEPDVPESGQMPGRSTSTTEPTPVPTPTPAPDPTPDPTPVPDPTPDRSSGNGSSSGGSGSDNQEPSNPVSTNWVYVGSNAMEYGEGKYHYPSCPSAKNILPENLIGWNTVAEAKAAGYKACGRCHPPEQ